MRSGADITTKPPCRHDEMSSSSSSLITFSPSPSPSPASPPSPPPLRLDEAPPSPTTPAIQANNPPDHGPGAPEPAQEA
ncbi:hypothetical protein EJ06DRAFT_581241 [Trichodelitschia bisporula]|uniref:Uncharacterized protein n=1 Tax=Trichodelitschia bisporula TaxID=703511 RepID=A0A6G1I1J9_9PEZI|nr:hypothetical protein EJ06DRAFT_581241 [Trichodelitschia bisporula]